jgi:hypothetical protein
MEEFVSLGKWWLPNNPEVVVAGKLNIAWCRYFPKHDN